MIYVGIDVGGTGIQVGLVDESGKILCKGGIVTRTDIPFDMQVKAMADCVLDTIDKGGYTLGDVKALRRALAEYLSEYRGVQCGRSRRNRPPHGQYCVLHQPRLGGRAVCAGVQQAHCQARFRRQ